jgi:predicted AlkP superfamily pyrophosphatase or phosphodiesterase
MALTGRAALLALAGVVIQLVAPGPVTFVGWLALAALLVGLDLFLAGSPKSLVWQRSSPVSIRLGGSTESVLTLTNEGARRQASPACDRAGRLQSGEGGGRRGSWIGVNAGAVDVNRTLALNVVGLTPALLEHAPNLTRLARSGGMRPLSTVTPAVTTTVQSTFVTGALPRDHGIVANGWYFRDLAEVWLWRQSNHLVEGEKLWETGRRRDPAFTCAKLFWWYNMYSSADIAVTPRPMYPADGRKLPDIYTNPPTLRDDLQKRLGQFPLFKFWGPGADIVSSQWIGRCALDVFERSRPTLTLVYLPHLDYNLQRLGPHDGRIPQDVAAVDQICGELIEVAQRAGARVIALSEYGITPVSNPVHINRALRQAGFIRIREELGRELLDPGASAAFAVADHQIAHVYVSEPGRIREVKTLLESLPGVERIAKHDGRSVSAVLVEWIERGVSGESTQPILYPTETPYGNEEAAMIMQEMIRSSELPKVIKKRS